MKRNNYISLSILFAFSALCSLCVSCNRHDVDDPELEVHSAASPITIESLLEEMVSFDENVYYPSPSYKSLQVSSTDIRSKSPSEPFWFGNKDNTRYIRIDNQNEESRFEKVIFEQDTPGVITRIWTTGIANNAQIRFYFDGETAPRISLSCNDLTKLPFYVPDGLVSKHQHYNKYWGTTLKLPIPYSKSCKVTIYPTSVNLAYHINFRSYEQSTNVESFTVAKAESLANKFDEIVTKLKSPENYESSNSMNYSAIVEKGKIQSFELPQGMNAVRTLSIKVNNFDKCTPEELMRKLVLRISFDSTECVRVPLGDYSGGGIGSRAVDSYYLTSDGHGSIVSRWIMPYKSQAVITIDNRSKYNADIQIIADCSKWKWYKNTLYFHCNWKQDVVNYKNDYESNNNEEWLFTSLTGRGVYKADALSLFNYGGSWFGEGDEKIYVDNESFPSHFGTGTEDYYDTSFAPVVVSLNPFGGIIRADSESSYGYNTFLRNRNLDGITFNNSFNFDFELLGWTPSRAIYSSTVWWYGDLSSSADSSTFDNEIQRNIPY